MYAGILEWGMVFYQFLGIGTPNEEMFTRGRYHTE